MSHHPTHLPSYSPLSSTLRQHHHHLPRRQRVFSVNRFITMAFTSTILFLAYITILGFRIGIQAQGAGGSLQDVLREGAQTGGEGGKYKYPTSFTQGIVPVSFFEPYMTLG
jgi:hypothetical protein